MGARPSGRFSGNEPMRLEFSESCARSDSEAASTPRSETDNFGMHGRMRSGQFPLLQLVGVLLGLNCIYDFD